MTPTGYAMLYDTTGWSASSLIWAAVMPDLPASSRTASRAAASPGVVVSAPQNSPAAPAPVSRSIHAQAYASTAPNPMIAIAKMLSRYPRSRTVFTSAGPDCSPTI